MIQEPARWAHRTGHLARYFPQLFDIPRTNIAVSDPMASGTHVMNARVSVNVGVSNQERRILLQKSSRINVSLVELCYFLRQIQF